MKRQNSKLKARTLRNRRLYVGLNVALNASVPLRWQFNRFTCTRDTARGLSW